MRTFKFLFLIVLVFTAFFASAYTYTVDVGQFVKLKVNGNIAVVYKNLPDSTGLVRYETDDPGTDIFKITTKGDETLKIEPADEKWGNNDLPVVYVYSNFLTSVESYSDKDVELVNVAPCSSFSINEIGNGSISVDNLKCNNLSAAITTGNGSIYLSGSCVNANFRMVGAGLISADRLRADNVKCRILGTGSIGCWPIDNLNVTGLGTTKIYYKGSPNIKKTGGGKLFELPDEMDEDAYSRLGTPVPSLNPPDADDDEEEDDDDDEEEEYQTVVTLDD